MYNIDRKAVKHFNLMVVCSNIPVTVINFLSSSADRTYVLQMRKKLQQFLLCVGLILVNSLVDNKGVLQQCVVDYKVYDSV